MDNETNAIKKMHEDEGKKKIDQLKKRIGTTKYNIEVSKEIIAETPSDTHSENMTKKNTQRQHAIGSIQKEIRDIEQTIEQRRNEESV
jgi:hypothetical protein